MGWPPAFAWVSSSLRSGVARATCDAASRRTYAEDQPMSPAIIYLGLDMHKDSITLAVLPADAPGPTRVDRLARRAATGEPAGPLWQVRQETPEAQS